MAKAKQPSRPSPIKQASVFPPTVKQPADTSRPVKLPPGPYYGGSMYAAHEVVPAASPSKDTSVMTVDRTRYNIQSRFDPLPWLTPEFLVQAHAMHRRGFIQRAVTIWDDIQRTDDKILGGAHKRQTSVTRHGYEIVPVKGMEKDARAQRHCDALEFFYTRLQVADAWNRNEVGGIKLLLRQMMDAVGKQFSCHEIVWQPGPDGLTAQLNFVPLWFFENTTGRLRFLEQDWNLYGVDLMPGEWMLSVGQGIMRACSICWMFKHLPLRDWLSYCERFGMPGLEAETTAQQNSDEWNQLSDALRNFGQDWALIHQPGTKITALDFQRAGEMAYPKLIEYMDKAIATLWRGGDLSTSSHSSSTGHGQGASVQGAELEALEQGDADWLSDTLGDQLDRYVIKFACGDTEPLAHIRVKTGEKKDAAADIAVDQFLLGAGFPIDVDGAADRYSRVVPEDGAELLKAPAPAGGMGGDLEENAEKKQFAGGNTATDGDLHIGACINAILPTGVTVRGFVVSADEEGLAIVMAANGDRHILPEKLATTAVANMVFTSEEHRLFLHAHNPKLAGEYEAHTPHGAKLPATAAPVQRRYMLNAANADNPALAKLLSGARQQLATAQRAALRPVAVRLAQIYQQAANQKPEDLRLALVAFRDYELPAMLKRVAADKATEQVLADTMAAALAQGLTSKGK